MVANVAAISVLVLALTAELLHARRARRIAHLAFGPKATPRPWVRFVPPARAIGLSLLTWGLVTLYFIDPQYRRPQEPPAAALRRILIALDASPSMDLKDAGAARDQLRAKRAGSVLMSVLDRISLEQARVSIVAFYTGAKPVVIDTRDPAVVKNIVDDLPLDYAFDAGKTSILDGIDEAFKIAKPWREKSATLLIVSDGDTVPYTGMPAMPPSIAKVVVIGVGDAKVGTFIDGHQSRQTASTLRQIANRLGGQYYDANDRNVPTQLIADLSGLLPIKDDSTAGKREAAIVATAVGGFVTPVIPLALALFATAYRPGRRERVVATPISRPIAPHLQGAAHA